MALSSESMGSARVTVANCPDGAAPTLLRGESGVRSSGHVSSHPVSRRRSTSYSASETPGSSSTVVAVVVVFDLAPEGVDLCFCGASYRPY